jgi:hypothetical protein
LEDRVEASEVRWKGQAIGSMSNAGFNCRYPESLIVGKYIDRSMLVQR